MPGKEWRNQIEMSDGVDVAHGLLPSAPTDRGIPRLVVAVDGTRPESTGPHHAVAVPGQFAIRVNIYNTLSMLLSRPVPKLGPFEIDHKSAA